MSWDDALVILESEFKNDPDEIESVDLLGGEPLTNFDLLKRISHWIWENHPGVKVFARTNGTLLTEDAKQWFSINKDRFVLGLSIDGTPDTNIINRGVQSLPLDFFYENWPNNPLKMTIFPDSVGLLTDSVKYLQNKGFNLIGGLAQGVKWSDKSCEELRAELEKLTEYYESNSELEPLSPLFDLDFFRAYWIPLSLDELDPPCWKIANIHTYDCDGELLPCQMFSSIVQGERNRKTILKDASELKYELLPQECQLCPIRWTCKNCMALNYQRYGNFETNINVELMCKAQKLVSYYSASLLISKANRNTIDLSLDNNRISIQNAIRYVKEFKE